MTYLGQTVVVALPQHEADRYNADNPALPAIKAGTVRPGIVVAINDVVEGATPTANVRIFHDGTLDHYVRNVPLSVLNDAASQKDTSAETANTGSQSEGRTFDQARVGDGTTFVGPGDERPAKPPMADQSPEPGSVISGVPVNSPWAVQAPAEVVEAPSNDDLWDAKE